MSRTESARERWTRIIGEQRASGLTVAAFCARRGIPVSTFSPWKRELGGARHGPPPGPVFVEATVRGVSDGRGGVTIQVGGRRVTVTRGFDRGLLLEVLEALEAGAAP